MRFSAASRRATVSSSLYWWSDFLALKVATVITWNAEKYAEKASYSERFLRMRLKQRQQIETKDLSSL
jgi:hypothetical protein